MFWGKQNSRELSFRQIFCAGMWCKTFFVPIDAAFASGRICILVHRVDLLLLLLAGLYWPDKTWSFKKFEAFAVLPLLVFFPYVFFPFFFFGVSCSFFPLSPELFCILPILSLFLFCPFCPPHLWASFWCLLNAAIEVGEFGWSKQNNQLCVFIISGISGSAQSISLKRIVTIQGKIQAIPGIF